MILDLHLHGQGQREWEARWYYGFMDATGETWYKSILGWLQSVTHVGQALLGMKASWWGVAGVVGCEGKGMGWFPGVLAWFGTKGEVVVCWHCSAQGQGGGGWLALFGVKARWW